MNLSGFRHIFFSVSLLSAGLHGCGNSTSEDGSDNEGGSGNDGGAGGVAESAVVTGLLVRSPEGRSTYLFAGPKMPTGKIDRGDGLELPDGTFFQSEHAVYFGSYEDGSISRYRVLADYSLEKTGSVSFANQGIQFINSPPLFFSETRAFYVAPDHGILIVWNPTTMEIEEEHDISGILRDGYSTYLGTPHKDGDRFIVPLLYVDDAWSATEPDSTIGLMLQDDPDEPIRLLRDERATGAFTGFTGPDGEFYVLGDALGGALALAHGRETKSPTLLRIEPGASELDPDYALDVGAAIDTPGLQGLWPVSGTKFVVQAWASDVDPAEVLETPDDYWAAAYFDWKMVDAATGDVTDITGIGRSAPYSTMTFSLDGRSFLQSYTATSDTSGSAALFELKENGEATQVAETGGEFWFLGRVDGAD